MIPPHHKSVHCEDLREPGNLNLAINLSSLLLNLDASRTMSDVLQL